MADLKKTNVYAEARKQAGLTQAEASERMDTVSEDRLARIEGGKINIDPRDIIEMADAYRRPDLMNYYCVHECCIGQRTVVPIETRQLPDIILNMLASLNAVDSEKNRLIEIAADGRINDDEMLDFAKIQKKLNQISLMANTLNLWVDQTIAEGGIDREKFEAVKKSLE